MRWRDLETLCFGTAMTLLDLNYYRLYSYANDETDCLRNVGQRAGKCRKRRIRCQATAGTEICPTTQAIDSINRKPRKKRD